MTDLEPGIAGIEELSEPMTIGVDAYISPEYARAERDRLWRKVWQQVGRVEELPEVGDPEKPKLVFFFDEAHLLFTDAPQALTDKVEQVVRLIRSKGVGVYFVTQNPLDVPDKVSAQLGNRLQHALRAFTPRDQKAVKAAASTFRAKPGLDTQAAIMELGVGEALVEPVAEHAALVGQGTVARLQAGVGHVGHVGHHLALAIGQARAVLGLRLDARGEIGLHLEEEVSRLVHEGRQVGGGEIRMVEQALVLHRHQHGVRGAVLLAQAQVAGRVELGHQHRGAAREHGGQHGLQRGVGVQRRGQERDGARRIVEHQPALHV